MQRLNGCLGSGFCLFFVFVFPELKYFEHVSSLPRVKQAINVFVRLFPHPLKMITEAHCLCHLIPLKCRFGESIRNNTIINYFLSWNRLSAS